MSPDEPGGLPAPRDTATPWPKSIDVLSRLLARRVSTTVRILRGQVRAFDTNFPQWRYASDGRGDWADRAARVLVFALISGQCGCGRHLRSCRQQGSCRCCVRGHALLSWAPANVPLGVFAGNAVRGSADTRSRHSSAQRVVWGDAFSRSMLRPVLDRAGLEPLVIGDAEIRRCAACLHRFERPAGADCCTSCGHPDHEAFNRREVIRHVLLYPEAGEYRRVRRVECRACGGFFDTARVDDGLGCPLQRCGSTQQLRCPKRTCTQWRDVDDLASPCAGCGDLFTVRCPECGANRTLDDILAGTGNCRCGEWLLGAVNERRRGLCRTKEIWVH